MEKNQPDNHEKSPTSASKVDKDKDSGAGDGLPVPVADVKKVEGNDGDDAVKEAKEEGEEEEERNVDKVNDDQESTQQIEETPTLEIHYTLELVAEDIDRFISTLSSIPKQELDDQSKDKENEQVDENENEKENEEEKEKEKETETEKENEKENEKEKEKEKEKEEVKMKLEVPVFVDKFLDLVDQKVRKGRLNEVQEETTLFMEAVSRLSNLLAAIHGGFDSDPGRAPLINRVGAIQQRAMSYLEDEFRLLLEEPPKPTTESSDSGKNEQDRQGDQSNVEEPTDIFPGYPPETVLSLKKIADQMIKAGYEYECREVYVVTRRNSLEETLNVHLGYEKFSIDEVHRMQWDSMEREIPTWTKTFKDCATVYFPGEKKLSDEVFFDHSDIAADLFTKVARSTEIQLLNFAEAVAMTKRSAEKLFKVLDMYETLRDHFAAVDNLFPEQFAKELKKEANTTRSRLGETAIYMFCDLENSIKSDTGKTPVPGGAVHPLTRYTMNYLRYACEYKCTLEQVFKEHWKIERADSTSRPRHEGMDEDQVYNSNTANPKVDETASPFSAQLMRVMDLLDGSLENKSKLYKDIPLSCVFMMNNGRYIVQKIKGSTEIYHVMGDTWCRKRSSNLRNYHKNYQRETWGKLLSCLGHEGLMVNGKLVKPVLKERFKSFNAMFDEIHRTQSTWVVSDEQLQSELRVSISAVVIPAYRSFMGRFSQYLDPGRQTEKYIKFQEEDIETYIEELFDGNQASAMARKR